MIFYAKSNPIETIKEHTDQLQERLKHFKNLYQSQLHHLTERDWELLEIAVKYHDVGKADLAFQNKLRQAIGKPQINVSVNHSIPHNFISVMCIPFKKLGLDCEEKKLVTQIVAFHHERAVKPDKSEVVQVYQENVLPYKNDIEEHMGIPIEEQTRPSKMNLIEKQKRIQPDDSLYYRYVLLKGLLHRLDHAASAHVPIELGIDMNVADHVNRFFTAKLKVEKNHLQTFTEKNQNHHLVVVAQTGMGKTEAGLLWLGNNKGFFTLPLRVSINAMFDRITDPENIGFTRKNVFGEEATGLLHSTSLDYLYDKIEGDDVLLEKIHSQSKEFANKLIISTIDQILKFPFYYLGFEKEYATMATSKVIIDELQAYDPRIAALLIRAMKLIDEVGGSFMIMTATLPDYYVKALKKELSSSRLPITYGEFIDDSIKRHHILVRDESVLDEQVMNEIKEKSIKNKILVICNTVDKAQQTYDDLKERQVDVTLLHSRFIKKDRADLEGKIMEFNRNDLPGVWVTTQLVEASLDIDFDLLFTEMSTLDSQFQRYGRCNRKGKKPVDQPNIHIFTQDVSGIKKGRKSVYHYDIYERSVELLKQYSKGLLLESVKHRMIKELYNEKSLEGTSFKKEFDLTLKQLTNRPHYEIKKQEAQDLLRDIQQVQAVPIQYAEQREFQEIYNKWKQSQSKADKRRYRKHLERYSVNVNEWRAKKIGITPLDDLKGLYCIHCDYSNEKGLLDQSESIFD
ncbi:MAG: CRISPR-associated helicase Cas3' [Bacillaceae bacterium]|nr:CRISPR-associated helicase Cas3' [Bacillaceae bacterium]